MKKKNFKRLFGFTRLVKPFAQIWTRAMTWQSSCTRNLRKPSFANAHSYGFTRLVKPLFGFTLAEVLITLSILGVVAAITVPSLIKRNEERSTVTKVLKAYSTLTHAYDVAFAEYGKFSEWPNRHKTLLSFLNTTKICSTSSETECFSTGHTTTLTGKQNSDVWAFGQRPSALLKDGAALVFWHHSDNCDAGTNKNLCSVIIYDTNGPKNGPNIQGKDIFRFWMTSNGITSKSALDSDVCSLKETTNGANGEGCTDYIIKNKNMNYLH